jgi:hypothetical protein
MESIHGARSHQDLWALGKQIEIPSRSLPSGFGLKIPSALLWSCYNKISPQAELGLSSHILCDPPNPVGRQK